MQSECSIDIVAFLEYAGLRASFVRFLYRVKPVPTVSVFGTKIEVKLEKDDGATFMWPNLEAAAGAHPPAPAGAVVAGSAASTSSASAAAATAPLSSGSSLPAAKPGPLPPAYSTKKDWSKVERDIKKDEEEEKPEGEEVCQGTREA
jgi:hypothetical protein